VVYKDLCDLEDKLILDFWGFSGGVKFKYLIGIDMGWLGRRKICLGRMRFWSV